jgi:hypothetical protein
MKLEEKRCSAIFHAGIGRIALFCIFLSPNQATRYRYTTPQHQSQHQSPSTVELEWKQENSEQMESTNAVKRSYVRFHLTMSNCPINDTRLVFREKKAFRNISRRLRRKYSFLCYLSGFPRKKSIFVPIKLVPITFVIVGDPS